MDLIAGPQGSGKSTFFPVTGRGRDAFNIDDHRRALAGESANKITGAVRQQATADYEAFIENHIRGKKDFSIEVTLAREVTFEQARRAKRLGFAVQLTFVAAELDECIARVAGRVERGGHGVLPDVIRVTHAASMKNLARALATFDVVEVYDNSRQAGLDDEPAQTKPRMVLEYRGGKVGFVAASLPAWLEAALRGTPFEI